MPALILHTNVKVEDPKRFSLDLSKFASKALDKPETYISISYEYNEFLTFAGNFDPAFVLVIKNEKYSNELFGYLERELGVPDHRGYIDFHDPGGENLGHKATIFSKLFGKK
ncbi:hypothetical protein EWM64_g905 [Hericium alpestre]|uniref:L-dopachrome isomerase n=1 Tax=Hericium alpestre TaxID=135208 RepID=A0A4Z0A7N5_9AGAM|nr:hypothetical protein EWM64_g905 [Hericium alpestre]